MLRPSNKDSKLKKLYRINHLKVIELYYVSKQICQHRYRNFFLAHQNTPGSKGTVFKNVNFDSEEPGNAGASMMCISSCSSENLDRCRQLPGKHKHKAVGVCEGDSGCKWCRKICTFTLNGLISHY